MAITSYMEDIDSDDYYGEYDIGDLLNQNMITMKAIMIMVVLAN